MPDIHDDEKLKARREYYRKWRRNNPERVAQIQKRFWQKKAAEIGLVQEPAAERTAADAPRD